MNSNPVPPQLATAAAVPPASGAVGPAPGQDPLEREPIINAIVAVEALLRQPRRVMYQLRQPGSGRLVGSMLFVGLVCSLVYGVVVGSFSMGIQLWAAPLKIAGGLLVCAIICLPSLYIFTCLSGSRAGLGEICGLLAGLVMLMTLLLLGFAPVAWLFSQSTNSVIWMGALHLLFWFIATVFGLRFLQGGFAHSQPRSSAGLNTWTLIFILVMLQMTTALRPLVGKSTTFFPAEKKFFIAHWGDCLKEQLTPHRTSAD